MAEDDGDEYPEYVKNAMQRVRTEDDYWHSVQDRFDDLRQDLFNQRLETREQAVGKKVGTKIEDKGIYWLDPEIGIKTRAWLLIPWNKERDEELLLSRWEFAKSVVPFIERHIKSRDLTVEFLSKWGFFCECATLVQEASVESPPVTIYLRDGLLHSIQARVLQYIFKILEENQVPDERFPPKWYRAVLSRDKTNLSPAFRELSLEAIRSLSHDETEIIPPTI
jgi:hypothetical protein